MFALGQDECLDLPRLTGSYAGPRFSRYCFLVIREGVNPASLLCWKKLVPPLLFLLVLPAKAGIQRL